MNPMRILLSIFACMVLFMSTENTQVQAVHLKTDTESLARLQAFALNKIQQDDDEDSTWFWQLIYETIEAFLYTSPIPGYVVDLIEYVLCSISDGFDFCEDDDE